PPQLGPPPAADPPALSALRAWDDELPAPHEPEGARLHAAPRGADHSGGLQPLALRAARRAGPLGVRGRGAGGAHGRNALPRHHPAPLSAVAGALHVPLVPPGRCAPGRQHMTSPVSLSDLPDYLKRQRWFGGKAWPIKSADVLDFLTVPSAHPSPFMLAVIEVTYELGHPERYVLSVTVPGARLEEALDHDANVQALFRLIRDGASIDSAGGTLVGEAFNAGAIPTSDTPDVRRLGVDQTNTSVVLGEAAILKVIRRMEPGANPEVEIGRTLQERTAFRAMPELLGTLQLDSQGPMTLAVLHRFIPNATDGWKFVTSALEQGAPT